MINVQLVSVSESQVLVQWDVPFFPNGPISFFNVCITNMVCSSAQPNATMYVLNNLMSLSTYEITVQPVTMFNGASLQGELSQRHLITINTTDPNVTRVAGNVLTDTGSITIELPNYQLFDGEVM